MKTKSVVRIRMKKGGRRYTVVQLETELALFSTTPGVGGGSVYLSMVRNSGDWNRDIALEVAREMADEGYILTEVR